MKTLKSLPCILLILCFNVALSQHKSDESEISKTTDKVKKTNTETKEALSTTKQTIKDIGSIFKSKKEKTKQTININITDVEYGNSSLEMLKNAIKSTKSVKGVTKKFKNNTATFLVEFKKSADELWQNLPVKTKSKFKVLAIEEHSMSITLKNAEPKPDNN
ncbi:hypothetical protein FEZ18_12265 [Oceanihabitans sp. IOP_32]|uniref:hypothetical protein n=1 Tax=Oceanihabitans sp. IOP_32 TaxID=2529032 RepID=UPI001292E99C|nr:hypothetical protein [Oceanihabitans sp. IOP_32]QFZ55521.1 hypothetical protein FEZ18_12265 [Oceanihabitans sp. IOP_32]